MKHKKLKRWIIGILLLFLISNIPPIKALFTFFLDEYHYKYSTDDGSFTFVEFKSRDTAMLFRRFRSYQEAFPNKKNIVLYRVFNKNPSCFWRWAEYFYDKRYKLPYKSWHEIRKKRGYDLKFSNNCQDF